MKKLGKYELLGELGHGAMGIVYRARDPIINRLVALKTITTGVADDPAMLERFYREAQSAGGLQHPNIVTIYDMGEAGSLPYIAMELVEGENLEQLIARRAPVPTTMKLVYAMQACRAFDYAHKRGIVHRDIKPGNIMLGKDGTVKVVDFGIARVMEASRTQTGMLIGTFAYMSPEQYHGEHADERSDIWSFGVLLYELLCYERPFKGPTPASLMRSICQESPSATPQSVEPLPRELEAIIARVLQKSPRDRYQSMEDLLGDLDPVCKKLQIQFVADLIEQGRQALEQSEFALSRDSLRQALQVESGNHQARVLLEKANTELRRLQNRPSAEQFIEKGRTLLDEGKFREAREAAESAMQLDSSFPPALELQRAIDVETERARVRAENLEAAKQRLAEGQLEEADELLALVLQAEPQNSQALVLQQQVNTEKAERQKRAHLQESLRKARELWTRQIYSECIQLLVDLEQAFPGDEEISRLLESAREDQIEQRKQQGLMESRNLLAGGRHDDCLALLTGLQKQFPRDEEIPRLLDEVRRDQTDRRRLDQLAQAKSFLGAGENENCISLLSSLRQEFPDDHEIPKLLEIARQNHEEQRRQQGLAEAGKHLAARHFDKCSAALAVLEKEFPRDGDILRLQDAVRAEQAEERKQKGLGEARNLRAAQRYDDSIALLASLEKQFPKDEDVLKLQQAVRAEQAEDRKHQRLQEARKLLGSNDYEPSFVLLLALQKEFPGEDEVQKMLASARKEQAEERMRADLAQARKFLAARQYDQSVAVLQKLEADFPGEIEITRLLQSTREEQSEQRKQKGLAEARGLLAGRHYNESIAILEKMQSEFPAETEIRKQLTTAREDLAEQEKQKTLSEARSRLAAQSFAEALALLNPLAEAFPKDTSVLKLRALVLREQEKFEKTERIQHELVALKKLMSERKYPEVLSRTKSLLTEFPGETNFTRLAEFAANQQATIEKDQLLRKTLAEVKSLFAANRFEEALREARDGLMDFPGNLELSSLAQQAEAQRKKLEVRQEIEMRIREIRVKINREKFSEAIDMAKETLVTMGPDTDLNQLLNSAQVEIAARERKRDQETTIGSIRQLMQAGDFDAATTAIEDALKTGAVESFDPRIQRLTEQISDAKTRSKQKSPPPQVSSPSTDVPPASLSREYAFLEPPPMLTSPAGVEQASTSQVLSAPPQPSQPTTQSRPLAPIAPLASVPSAVPVAPAPPMAPIAPSTNAEPQAFSAPVATPLPAESILQRTETPVEPSPTVPRISKPTPAPDVTKSPVKIPTASAPAGVPVVRDQALPVEVLPALVPPTADSVPFWQKPIALAALAVALLAAAWAGVHFLHPASPNVVEPAVITKPQLPAPTSRIDPLEAQQREALNGGNKLIATNDLAGARQKLQEAVALKGPLTSDIQKKISEIDESLKDAGLRQLRQSEENLWQQAMNHTASGRFPEAQKDLRQVLALPLGGVHRDEAQNYLDKIIPQRMQQNKSLAQARQALKQGDFSSARQAADQLRQRGGDFAELAAEIDTQERARLGQLESQFNQLKDRDDDSSVQQLKALSPKFQALSGDGGPQSSEASNYANGVPAAVSEVQARMQKKAADAEFQRTVQKYQQAINDNDKNGLIAARNEFQAVAQGGGPHADEAQKYRADVDNKLAALNQPPAAPPPVAAPPRNEAAPAPAAKAEVAQPAKADNDADVRAVIQRYAGAYNQRDADALRQIRPSLSAKDYTILKRSFEAASSIRAQIAISSVEFYGDGSKAVVKGQMSQDYTMKGTKVAHSNDATEFRLAKSSNGAWLITDVK